MLVIANNRSSTCCQINTFFESAPLIVYKLYALNVPSVQCEWQLLSSIIVLYLSSCHEERFLAYFALFLSWFNLLLTDLICCITVAWHKLTVLKTVSCSGQISYSMCCKHMLMNPLSVKGWFLWPTSEQLTLCLKYSIFLKIYRHLLGLPIPHSYYYYSLWVHIKRDINHSFFF